MFRFGLTGALFGFLIGALAGYQLSAPNQVEVPKQPAIEPLPLVAKNPSVPLPNHKPLDNIKHDNLILATYRTEMDHQETTARLNSIYKATDGKLCRIVVYPEMEIPVLISKENYAKVKAFLGGGICPLSPTIVEAEVFDPKELREKVENFRKGS